MGKWKSLKYFKQEYYIIGDWDFTRVSKFPHTKFIAADTETKLYYNDELLSEERAYELYKTMGQKWIKQNIEVRPYAFTLADKDNFAIFQNAEDFITACAMLNVKKVFWYNAKFDFAIFDYYFLTNDWKRSEERVGSLNGRKKLPDKTFQSLDGDFGQRYQMRIWKEYTNRKSIKKVHSFRMIDICNVFSGGLAYNLKSWNIKENGTDVTKLKMDYVNAGFNDNDIQYMYNDTKGLYLLAEEINKTIEKISSFSLFNGDYITAGGLAKKSLLKFMFEKSHMENIELFKKCFPITAEEDKDFRKHKLYLGGKSFVNPYKKAIIQHNIYKYDVNSMYPDKMRNMAYPFGRPKRVDRILKDGKHIYILKIKNLVGAIKDKMVPIWQDALTGDYVELIREYEERYIWYEELKEYERWYYLEYDIVEILEYKARYPLGVVKYVDTYYDIKSHSKGAIKNGAKLFLNSAYGKIAQRIERVKCHYEMSELGYVHLIKDGEEVDEKSMLSVVVGSRITALARCHLMEYIRLICGENVRDNFIYCDTDSVHALCEYTDTDDKELGKMKFEGLYQDGLYLAPKTYLLHDNEHYEVHCKGVNTNVVESEIKKCNSFKQACEVFRPNRTFKCLCALNTKGGKALIYIDKMIVHDDKMIIRDSDDDCEVI